MKYLGIFSFLYKEQKATVDTPLPKIFFLLVRILTFLPGSLGTEPGRQ